MKVCGQGEWHTQKHGEKHRKSWKKLHIGVNAQGHIIASSVTDGHAQDPPEVPAVLGQVDREIDRFIGDGMYDQAPVYAAVPEHSPSVRLIVPPRKDAVLRPESATSPTPRDRHLVEMQRTDRFAWKRTSGS